MAAAAAVAADAAAAAKTKSEVKHVRSLRAAHRLAGLLAVGLVHRLAADAACSWGSSVCGCCGHSDWLWLPPLACFLRAAPLVCLSARFGPIITLACCRHISHFFSTWSANDEDDHFWVRSRSVPWPGLASA